MVFNKNVDRNKIEKFESDTLDKVSKSSMFALLKRELIKKKLNFKIRVQHTELDLKKYCSHLMIDVFDEKGKRVCEYDEPNCCLMICETICYVHHGHIVGIDLNEDKAFLESLRLLINQVQKYE